MQNTKVKEEFNIPGLIDGMLRINRKVMQNYLKNSSGYSYDNRSILHSYYAFFNKVATEPKELHKVQESLFSAFQKQMELVNRLFFEKLTEKEVEPIIIPQKDDRRFSAPEWSEYPFFDFLKQNYLLFEELWDRIIEEVEIDAKKKKRLEFYTNEYVDFFSPANFLTTNPEVLKLAFETKGNSLWKGFNNLVHDIERGKLTQTDESAFEVGKNLAITPGAVIYENELIQLIQYSHRTKNVHEIPLLIVPPWINKYYILDLQPQNSFVKYFLDQGFTIYMISWRNPKPGMGYLSMDDYVEKGVLKAIEVGEQISHSKKINCFGYCLGGTLLSVALAILSKRKGTNPINFATFHAAMIDFSDVGPMGNVIDTALIRKLERRELLIDGEGDLLKDGVLHGHDMERAFNLIRENDMVWKYVTDNYLKGTNPSAFDLMYWTNDNTNLPATMYLFYLKKMVYENKLRIKDALRICDVPIDISKIKIPVCVTGLMSDYIAPAKTVFKTTELVSGPVEFILGGSGHTSGTINPPWKNKYGYFLNGKLGKGFEEWKKTATAFEGSWWTPWTEILRKHSGKKIPATSKLGKDKYKVIEEAPGSYVKVRLD